MYILYMSTVVVCGRVITFCAR